MTGEYEQAETLLEEAHEINLKIGDTDGIASNDNLFAVLALFRNDPDVRKSCPQRPYEYCKRGLRRVALMIPWTSWQAPPHRGERSVGPRKSGARRLGFAGPLVLTQDETSAI